MRERERERERGREGGREGERETVGVDVVDQRSLAPDLDPSGAQPPNRLPVPHKDCLDVYKKMSGQGSKC